MNKVIREKQFSHLEVRFICDRMFIDRIANKIRELLGNENVELNYPNPYEINDRTISVKYVIDNEQAIIDLFSQQPFCDELEGEITIECIYKNPLSIKTIIRDNEIYAGVIGETSPNLIPTSDRTYTYPEAISKYLPNVEQEGLLEEDGD